jgi:DNA-binding transcriptional LysR family regulator
MGAHTRYRTPALLEPIQLLDYLEVCGTTSAAAQALALSQPTVSRRARALEKDLGLQRRRQNKPEVLRYGDTTCLRLLRQASQSHRLEAGVWRAGTSVWHQPLVEQLQPTLVVPPLFRHPLSWRELVENHAIDGALISGLDLQLVEPQLFAGSQRPIQWGACVAVPIATWPLGLVLPPSPESQPPRWAPVAVPGQQTAPGMAALVRQQQWRCLQAGPGCQALSSWLAWLEQEKVAALAAGPWAKALRTHLPYWRWQPLQPGPDGQPARDQLWFLLHRLHWEQASLLHELAQQLIAAAAAFDADPD